MASIAHRRLGFAAAGCLAVAFVTADVSAGQAPSAKDLSTAIEMLRSPDPVVRVGVACARNVFNASAAPAIPVLVELLDDAEPVAPEVCREDHRRWWATSSQSLPARRTRAVRVGAGRNRRRACRGEPQPRAEGHRAARAAAGGLGTGRDRGLTWRTREVM
jgi:hypothetical protein